MNNETKTITAWISGTEPAEFVRVRVPAEFYHEPTAGHRQIDTGVVRIGHYVGRRWAVVQDWSCWEQRDGSCEGCRWTAYDLRDSACDRWTFANVLAGSHYTDSEYGRRVEWPELLNGACDRPATDDERRKLEEAGYSADDAKAARVLAQNRGGARFYRIPHNGYAVEAETGEMIADLDAEEALMQWK